MTGSSSSEPPRTVAVVDPCCAGGYDWTSFEAGGLGGTEATVLRVSRALSRHVEMVLFQKGRDAVGRDASGLMRPLPDAFGEHEATAFVVINSWKVACKLRKAHRHARILLWLHVHPGRHNRPMAEALSAAEVDVVCVSRSQAAWLRGFLDARAALRIDHVYNPVVDDLAPDATSRDPARLLFASSPHKGLAQVFSQFRAAREAMPDLTLAVADPGYLAWDTGPVPDGVIFLGVLPHDALIREMRRSLCLFYPQTTFAETFGLVLAEANAVGTPVLVHHGLGANAEVAGDPAQLVDGADPAAICDRLRRWRARPPVVRSNPDFRLHAVTAAWSGLLDLDPAIGDTCRKVA